MQNRISMQQRVRYSLKLFTATD